MEKSLNFVFEFLWEPCTDQPVHSESLLGSLWVAEVPMILHTDSIDSDQTKHLSLRWGHMPTCTLCWIQAHITLHMSTLIDLNVSSTLHTVKPV